MVLRPPKWPVKLMSKAIQRRRRLWIAVSILGLLAFSISLGGIVVMAVVGEWLISAVVGAIGGMIGGVGCVLAALYGLRSMVSLRRPS